MNYTDTKKIIKLIKEEVVPALGCTEPIAVAIATAKAKEVLNMKPEKINIFVSKNIYKNGMGVGIPSTGMIGLNIAAALGATGGVSEYKLEVLKNINTANIREAKKMVQNAQINVNIKDKTDTLYIESICIKEKNYAKVIIEHTHSNIVLIELNNKKIFEKQRKYEDNKFVTDKNDNVNLNVEKIFDFATNAKFADIKFILKGAEMNRTIAEQGLKKDYGMQIGKRISKNIKKGLLKDDILSYALLLTTAAADARMSGSKYPVMSNYGSGNQGLTTFIPVIAVAEKINADKEHLAKALIISNLINIYIKTSMDRLSSLCGVMVAAIGASCGITYLLGGKLKNINYAIKNVIANVTGIICDGAKPGCSLKVYTGVSSAILSALLAIDNIGASKNDGIIDDDVEKTIKNYIKINEKNANQIDKTILNIMIDK